MTETYEFPTPFTAWLVCIYFVLQKARRDGLMSIEGDVDTPHAEKSLFRDFPQTLQEPYLEFATDLLRVALGGNLNADEVSLYVEHAIAGHTEAGVANIQLLKTIWLIIRSAMMGYTPHEAIEFGRQAIPVAIKPTYAALKAEYQSLSQRGYQGLGLITPKATTDVLVEKFMDSILGKKT